MINAPSPVKGLDIRILIIIPTKGRGFINQGSTLGGREFRVHGRGLLTIRCTNALHGIGSSSRLWFGV